MKMQTSGFFGKMEKQRIVIAIGQQGQWLLWRMDPRPWGPPQCPPRPRFCPTDANNCALPCAQRFLSVVHRRCGT